MSSTKKSRKSDPAAYGFKGNRREKETDETKIYSSQDEPEQAIDWTKAVSKEVRTLEEADEGIKEDPKWKAKAKEPSGKHGYGNPDDDWKRDAEQEYPRLALNEKKKKSKWRKKDRKDVDRKCDIL